ncbi:MAG: type II secretion system protein [Elusimicrobia bacterium]|nr:type II secretion system protein [Elusimicrobiota bacterium]
MPRSRSNGGFALIEVLVATAILSAGCILVVQALTTALKGSRTLQDRYRAALAVEDALWTMDQSGGNFDALQVQTPDGFQNAAWTSRQVAATAGGLSQNSVTLRWTAPGGARANRQEDLTLSAYASPDEQTSVQ